MVDSPEAVLLYIPLMKELGMSWKEIKYTPRYELQALCKALYEHTAYHCMDGYSANEISKMAKDKPEDRQQYHLYLETRRKYDEMIGVEKKVGFGDIK